MISRTRRILLLAAACLLIMAALLALPMPVSHAQDGATPTPIPAEEALRAAEEALKEAQRATDAVSFVLNFFEVAGVLIGLLLAAGTFAGFRTIGEYRGELKRARQELEEQRAEFTRSRQAAEQTLRDIEQRITGSLADVQQRGEYAARAGALMQLGVQQMEAHNYRAALHTFEEARALDPNNRAVNYYLGELYIQQRDLERAIELLRASGTEYPPAEAALGFALRLQAERHADPNTRNRLYAQAEQHFLNALEHDPQARDINGASFYATLGGLYRRQGRVEDAIRAYEAATHVTPHSSYPFNNLAMLYLMQGKLREADQAFQKSARTAARVIDGDPFDHWARFDMITAQVATGEYDSALRQLDLLAESPPSVGALESLLSGLEAVQSSARGTAVSEQVIGRLQEIIAQQRAHTDSTRPLQKDS
ncbi:MAG: hypothetical protein DYG88_09520 [Chloroflexi bacterium CFX4]|nr:hypothetical protein [Chloroflexi bacterium CFX4]MDL1923643.1 tetratricopeptide repeat protein [Chloroflexi bacterium CFX3]